MGNHIQNVVFSKKIKVAPYCYFHTRFVDYEPKIKSKFSDELANQSYAVDMVDLNNELDIEQYVAPTFKKIISRKKISTPLCGLIGVPILDIEDPMNDPIGDHYVSFVFQNNELYYFDSAIDKDYKDTETYKILVHTFTPDKVIVNKKTFETAGGISNSVYNYVGQNIFCHSWSLWFLYEFIVNEKTMAKIDSQASKSRGEQKDKQNLIMIKRFIYNTLIPKLGLDILYSLSLFENFKFITIKSPTKLERIIE